MRLGLLAAGLLLAGCGQKAEEAPKVEAPAAPTLASAASSVAYTCEKDLPITAIAGTSSVRTMKVSMGLRVSSPRSSCESSKAKNGTVAQRTGHAGGEAGGESGAGMRAGRRHTFSL